jgi:hypothetical protein
MNTRAPLHGILLSILTLATASASELNLEVDERPELTTFDGLHPVKTDIVDHAWIRTPLNWSGYTKIFLQKAPSHYRYLREEDPASESHIEITREAREKFEDRLSTFIRSQLNISPQFQITDKPAPDVATLWGALVDVHVRKEEAGEHGEFILVAELRDSMTEDVLIRTVDSHHLDLDATDEAGNLLEVDRVAEEIAAKMRQTLDAIFAALVNQ